jgi:hypothetical protein
MLSQGSVLGPLLFPIYINDMPDMIDNLCKLFADDSKLIGIVKSAEDLAIVKRHRQSSIWGTPLEDEVQSQEMLVHGFW